MVIGLPLSLPLLVIIGHVDFIMRSSCDFRISDTVRVNITDEPACSRRHTDCAAGQLDGQPGSSLESGDYSNTEGNWHSTWMWTETTSRTGSRTSVLRSNTAPATELQWSTISPDTLSLNANGTSDVDFEWAPLDGGAICNMLPGADSTYCLGYEGEVLLRAYSVCENEFAILQVSPIVTGYVDFIRPELSHSGSSPLMALRIEMSSCLYCSN